MQRLSRLSARAKARLIVATVFVAMLLIAIWTLPLGTWLDQVDLWIEDHLLMGALLFVMGFVVGCALMLPASIMVMSGGYLFGFTLGVPIVLLGTAFGALAACLIGRNFARHWVADYVDASPRLSALDNALEEQGFWVVVLTRLSLLMPFSLLNYAYGLTRVRVLPYFLATALGMIPVVALYVYVGTLAKNVEQLLSGELTAGPASKWLFGAGLVATIALVVVVHRTASRALQERMG